MSSKLKTIACPVCGNLNPFDTESCLKCGLSLGPIRDALVRALGVGTKEDAAAPSEKMVEFQIDEEGARSSLSKWLEGGVFGHRGLSSLVSTTRFQAIHAPVYECNCEAIINWRGEYDEEHKTVGRDHLGEFFSIDGKDGPKYKTQTYKVQRKIGDEMNDKFTTLIPASSVMDEKTFPKIAPFKLDAAVPIASTQSRAVLLEKPTIAGEKILDSALARVKEMAEAEIVDSGQADAVDYLSATITKSTIICIYVPLWVWEFSYKGKQYRALMNAQTGKTAGSKPGVFG